MTYAAAGNGKANEVAYARVIDRYRSTRLDEYRRQGALSPDSRELSAFGDNPTCGDTLEMTFVLERDAEGVLRVADAKYKGHGCALCMASADLLVDELCGKTPQDVLSYEVEDLRAAWGGLDLGRSRQRCMDLSLRTAHRAMRECIVAEPV